MPQLKNPTLTQKEIDELKEKIEELEFKIECHDTLFKEQEVLKNKSHANNAELRKENEKLEERIMELIDENGELKEYVNPYDKEINDLRKEIATLKRIYDNICDAYGAKYKKIEGLKQKFMDYVMEGHDDEFRGIEYKVLINEILDY